MNAKDIQLKGFSLEKNYKTTMFREIGSEFHQFHMNEKQNSENLFFEGVKDFSFVFSGRTAMETILVNLPNVKSAMLPSYCCESMIVPFEKAGIKVSFYEVDIQEELTIELDISEDIDLLVWCNYFGFYMKTPDFGEFVKRGGIIVEDITHSLLSEKPYHIESHFLVASIRKWFPVISGGYCASRIGVLINKPVREVPDMFVKTKKEAMLEKKQYLETNDMVLKESYMRKYNYCNRWLSKNYSNFIIDEESAKILEATDIESVKRIRRENARMIYKKLGNQLEIIPLFKEEYMDCPLFVPVLVREDKRDEIRKKLIENNIFCPVHWPKPSSVGTSVLYSCELSLICDQRYNEQDMEWMISCLLE